MQVEDKVEELKKLIQEDIRLNRQNNLILHRLKSALRWGMIFSVLKWAVVIGAAAGAYYLFQPILDQFSSAYEGFLNFFPGGNN